ncbi:acetyltransferase [Jeotgalibacillus malaysiensis]|uniref:acetyltransferase n=1 Tax=Jeotgalibacillus malaysiensis TaxID=1508404 RepID=UPI003850750A
MTNKILIVGGGGHCHSVLDSLLTLGIYDEIAIIDKKESVGNKILSLKVTGADEDIPGLLEAGYSDAFVTIGNNRVRKQISEKLERMGFRFPCIIDPQSTVSSFSNIGKGVFIGKKAVVNSNSFIGNGSIVNTSSVVEHDCHLEDFTHIAPGATLCGGVKVGETTHVGAASVVREQLTIGSNTTIGMGSVVVSSIKSNALAYGNPCKER